MDIIFGFLYSLCQSIVFYFCWTVLTLLIGVHVYVYISLFSLLFADFVIAISLGFIFGFSFLDVCFSLT